jgi:molecular chaperone Hsp33
MTDLLQRFLFEQTDIRGELVRLDQSYTDALSAHDYPETVQRLLGEFLAAAALLSATLKIDGSISLQARSNGEVPLIMAEANSDHCLRGIARGADEASSTDFTTLLRDGLLTISIEPRKGRRYQGIVALEGDNLAQCLEAYFRQSEQLETKLWFCTEAGAAAGMMLQQLPATATSTAGPDDWEHILQLTNTITSAELLELEFNDLLYRLYNQEPIRVFAATALRFRCSCSQERTLNALTTLGEAECLEIIQEQGSIETHCEFCHQHYQFNRDDVTTLFRPPLH